MHSLAMESDAQTGTQLNGVDHLTGEERNSLSLWNRHIPASVEQCIQVLFEDRARQQPQASAISSWDGELTYDMLDSLASRLAYHLVQHGVGPEVLVLICFEKSKWAIVAILAVLKAGGAFVPMDPNHPPQRQEAIIRQTNPKILLASSSFASHCPHKIENIIAVDETMMQKLAKSAISQPLGQRSQPGNLAYVIFTSGSTGLPKGVMIEHSAICSSSLQHGQVLGFNEGSRVLQFSSFIFDVSVMDILTTLIFGGCICIPSDDDRMNDIAGVMNRLRVTLATLTPSIAHHLQPDGVQHLRTLVLAGEQLTYEIVERWSNRVEVINAYGPTECAVICSAFNHSLVSVTPATIGQAIASTFWIVDPLNSDKLAHVGDVGELLIEGPILARGYLNNASATTACFITEPLWRSSFGTSSKTRRMYKTGDLVQYSKEGDLVYLGRKDFQVKIHGQRVELHEIEHHIQKLLPEQPQVAVDLACTANENRDLLIGFICVGEHWGCAWVGSRIEMTPEASERFRNLVLHLEDGLKQTLPAYMIPSLFIPLPKLPLTASAKIDRGQLRKLISQNSHATLAAIIGNRGTASSQALTRQQATMAALWSSVLPILADQILPDDNFFKLGADSLTAIGLVAAARRQGMRLTVADIFKKPQLHEMALVSEPSQSLSVVAVAPFSIPIDEVAVGSLLDEASTHCSLPPELIEDIYPCTPYQEELWMESMECTGLHCVQRKFALSDELNIDAFRSAWAGVPFSALQNRIFLSSRGLVQVVPKTSTSWTSSKDLHATLEDHKKRIGIPGNPLSLCTIVEDQSSSKKIFVWTAHHALYDRWSVSLFFEQVAKLYQRKLEHAVTANFNSFVQHTMQINRPRAETFWRSHLAGADCKPVVQVPTGTIPTADSVLEYRVLSPKLASDFTTATKLYVTWQVLAGKITQSLDTVSAITLAGRNTPVAEVDRLIGPTIGVVPLRTKLSEHGTVYDLLSTVQNQVLESLPFQHFGYKKICELSDEARLACIGAVPVVIQSSEMTWGPNIGVALEETAQLRHPASALVWNCTITHDGVNIKAEFDPRFVNADTVGKWLRAFEYLYKQVASADAKHTLAHLDLDSL